MTLTEAKAEALELFRNVEWQVARVRRALEQHDKLEEEKSGRGDYLISRAEGALVKAVDLFANCEGTRHVRIDNTIEAWHDDPGRTPDLHIVLGWTWDEYTAYIERNELPPKREGAL